MVNEPLVRPYFWGCTLGGRLASFEFNGLQTNNDNNNISVLVTCLDVLWAKVNNVKTNVLKPYQTKHMRGPYVHIIPHEYIRYN